MTMTDSPQYEPVSGSRRPYVGAVAFFLLLALVGVAFLIPKLRHEKTLQGEARAASGPPTVLAVRLQAGSRGGHMELPATVQAYDQTPVFARTSGYLKERYVDIGDHVRQGQLLAIIDDPQTTQALMQARATLAQDKAQLAQAKANAVLSKVTNDRWQTLVKEGVVAQQDADTKLAQAGADAAAVNAAQANIAAGEANVANLEAQAGFARVVAPFDGIILSRAIDKGSLISSGSQTSVTQMFTIGQSNTIRVFASVPQADAVGLVQGYGAKVTFRELPGKVYAGVVQRTSQSIDTSTRTLLVEVDLKNDGQILPGMYATVIFDLPHTTAAPVLLPANALVIRTAGPQAVVVDSDNIAHFRSITLGRDLGSATEVTSGLQPGDVVVMSPGDAVVDGKPVRPQFR
jgi:RND family efflux transporter MFP subunit